jgi:hypothetical protein
LEQEMQNNDTEIMPAQNINFISFIQCLFYLINNVFIFYIIIFFIITLTGFENLSGFCLFCSGRQRAQVCRSVRDVFAQRAKVCPAVEDVFAQRAKVCPAVEDVFAQRAKVCPVVEDVFAQRAKVCPAVEDVFAQRAKVCRSVRDVCANGQKFAAACGTFAPTGTSMPLFSYGA